MGHPWRGPASREGWDTHGTKANTRSRDPAAPSPAPSGAEPRGRGAPPHLLPPTMIPSQPPAPICWALLWELAALCARRMPPALPAPFPTLPSTHGSGELGQDPGSSRTPLRPPVLSVTPFPHCPQKCRGQEAAEAGQGAVHPWRNAGPGAPTAPETPLVPAPGLPAQPAAAHLGAGSSPPGFCPRISPLGLLLAPAPPKAGPGRGLRVSPPQAPPRATAAPDGGRWPQVRSLCPARESLPVSASALLCRAAGAAGVRLGDSPASSKWALFNI